MIYKLTIAAVLILLLSAHLRAQQIPPDRPQLSEKHRQKLAKITDPERKLKKYKKYIKMDSIKWERSRRKALKRTADSLFKVHSEKFKKNTPNIPELPVEMEAHNRLVIDSLKMAVQIDEQYSEKIKALLGTDSTLIQRAAGNVNYKVLDEALPQLPVDTSLIKSMAATPDSVLVEKAAKILADSLGFEVPDKYRSSLNEVRQLKDSASFDYITSKAGEKIEAKAAEIDDIAAFKEKQAEFDELADEFKDPAGGELDGVPDDGPSADDVARQLAIEQKKHELKKQMVAAATEHLKGHADKVEAAQAQLSKLKRKYSKVVNSNDLSTAVKRSSLKGRGFGKRLVIGGNFQIQSFDPVILDASPVIGYRFNKLFNAGIGGHWRYSFKDSVSLSFPSATAGYKAWVSHDVFRSFFGYSEYERQRFEKFNPAIDSRGLAWKDAWHIGIGRNIPVNRLLTTQVLVLYNVLHDPFDKLYNSRLNVRAGVKLNTGAFKGKP
jgi:hypothetical protein